MCANVSAGGSVSRGMGLETVSLSPPSRLLSEMPSLNFLLRPLCLLLAAKPLSNGSLLPLWNFNCTSWDFEIMVINRMANGQPISFTVQLEVFFVCKSAGIIIPRSIIRSLSTWTLRRRGSSAPVQKLHN